MPPSPSRPDRIGRRVAGFVRQFELPFFDGARAAPPVTSLEPKARNQRSIRLGERILDYAFRRGRRRTIGFTIDAQGLRIAAPRWTGIGEVEDAIRERQDWIFTKLAEMQKHRASIPRVRWQDGGSLPYLGDDISLCLASPQRRATSPVFNRDARTLTVALPPQASEDQLRDRVQAWLQAEARVLFLERIALFETRLGVRHRVLRLSSAKTRWGSCSADGRILLNWRLIHFPLSSIDYVVAHELAHLKEMNHGPRFWATVATVLPDYEATRDRMKRHPPELLPTL